LAVDSKDNGADQRRFPRSPMILKVEYENASDFLSDYTENISDGGVFIATAGQFERGKVIAFSISFPGLLDPIQVAGEVAWIRPQATRDEPAGIGVQFLVDRSPGRQSLENLLSRLQRRGEMHRAGGADSSFRVMLVEDNVVVRDMFRYGIQKLSQREGFPSPQIEVIEADDGKEAWDLLQKEDIQLVIVDLYMPVMDGGQLIELIRADQRLADLPILVVSSGGQEGRQRAIQSGADVYLDKPIKLKQMMETIETLITIGHAPA
jgi:uncharacterized protein (TIGR02266 family)